MRKSRAKLSDGWVSYDFAVLRVVPHVYIGTYVPVGVIVHARTTEFLGMRVLTNATELEARAPGVDEICRGDQTAGPIALAPPSERFHWLTAPRSDVIQCGPVHEGVSDNPAAELDQLFASVVTYPSGLP